MVLGVREKVIWLYCGLVKGSLEELVRKLERGDFWCLVGGLN